MKRLLSGAAAFSLVELTLALGVAAFCMIAILGLLPAGVQTNRNATSQTSATNILAVVVADMRATPKSANTWTGTSPLFCIALGTPKTLYFDGEGRASADLAGLMNPCGGVNTATVQTRYRVTITFPSTGNLTYADVKITWPAATDPNTTTPAGLLEMFAALDRK